MPVDQKKMAALVKQYGPEKGRNVYYALEEKDKKSGHMRKSKKPTVKKNKINKRKGTK